MKKYLLALIVPALLNSAECSIDYKMMWSIADNEHHNKRDVGYPYLISFNKQSDRLKLKPEHRRLMLDKRTLDCRNQSLCTEIASYMISTKRVTNMDMGPFQVCYKFHGKKMALHNFFSLKESFVYAKSFAQSLVNRHGCSWQALARYHSATPKYNTRYARRLKHVYYSN